MFLKKAPAAVVLAAGIALGTPVAAQAADYPASPAPRILKVDNVRWHPGDNTVTARVSYRCTDRPAPRGTMHFAYGGIQLGPEWDRSYSMGWRNGPGGTVRVMCTGKRVTNTFTFLPNDETFYYPAPPPGTTTPVKAQNATLNFSMFQTASYDAGGWYIPTGVETSTEGTVYVRPAKR